MLKYGAIYLWIVVHNKNVWDDAPVCHADQSALTANYIWLKKGASMVPGG